MPNPSPPEPIDDPRRSFLIKALALGWLTAGGGWNTTALADIFGKRPAPLPPGQSIFDLQGEVWINDAPATLQSQVRPTDTLRTGRDARLIVVVGKDALLLREKSTLELRLLAAAPQVSKQLFRLVTGALLTVFGRREEDAAAQVRTANVNLGIRGTGAYVESRPDETYACTCYGRILLTSVADPSVQEEIRSRHHDAPRYILAQPRDGRLILPAPFINHTDAELMMLEALVGREVPFGLMDDQYRGPRRDY